MAEFTTTKDFFATNGELVPGAPTAITATTTSAAVYVGDRDDLSIHVSCAGHTAGNGVFTVLVSNDGLNFPTYQRLTTDASVIAGSTPALVNSVTLNANGSDLIFFPNGDHFAWIKVKCTVTTDGSYTAVLHAA